MSCNRRGLFLALVGLSFALACPAVSVAEKKHPAEEKGLKSGDSDVEAKIKFDNKSGKTVKV